MEKKETAEQKLLKIIENPKNEAGAKSVQGQNAALQMAAAVKNSGLPTIPISSFLDPLMGLIKGRLFTSAPAISFGLKEINRILFIALILVISAFTINLFYGMRLLNKKVTFSIDTKLTQDQNDFTGHVKEISQYLNDIHKRNIFEPFEKKIVPVEEDTPSETKRISSLAKNLRLVGISWLDSPESASAMIEDTTSGVTQFLKPGEKINGVTIKIIYADRVILSYEGEEAVIKL